MIILTVTNYHTMKPLRINTDCIKTMRQYDNYTYISVKDEWGNYGLHICETIEQITCMLKGGPIGL